MATRTKRTLLDDADDAPAESPAAETVPVERPREYVVVARRYRPQAFDELIGQQHVAKALTNAISTSRVGHAYLFTGARGVGKTSAARRARRTVAALAGAIALAAVPLAGCGDDGGGDSPEKRGAAPKPAAKRAVTVDIASFKFRPETITIRAGGTVTFVNRDRAPHTAQTRSCGRLSSRYS